TQLRLGDDATLASRCDQGECNRSPNLPGEARLRPNLGRASRERDSQLEEASTPSPPGRCPCRALQLRRGRQSSLFPPTASAAGPAPARRRRLPAPPQPPRP